MARVQVDHNARIHQSLIGCGECLVKVPLSLSISSTSIALRPASLITRRGRGTQSPSSYRWWPNLLVDSINWLPTSQFELFCTCPAVNLFMELTPSITEGGFMIHGHGTPPERDCSRIYWIAHSASWLKLFFSVSFLAYWSFNSQVLPGAGLFDQQNNEGFSIFLD